jgi:predicted amidophosphoribosyltransferase
MAVCWRCPRCNEVSCEDDVTLTSRKPVDCDHCRQPFPQDETLCPVCDAPNPWVRRDSIHFWCRECGTMQAFHSHRHAS